MVKKSYAVAYGLFAALLGAAAASAYPVNNPTYIPTAQQVNTGAITGVAASPVFSTQNLAVSLLNVSGTFSGLTANVQCANSVASPVWVQMGFRARGSGNVSAVQETISATGTYALKTVGYAECRLNATALSSGSVNLAWSGTMDNDLQDTFPGTRVTYSGTVTGLVPASSATDIAVLPGASGVTVRVDRICVSGRATAAASADVQLVKRSVADTGGTSAAITSVPNDANDPAQVSLPLSYTANPTVGSAVGTLGVKELFLGNLTTGQPTPPVCWSWANDDRQQPTLRGTAQQLAINLNGATFSGGLIDIEFELTEE